MMSNKVKNYKKAKKEKKSQKIFGAKGFRLIESNYNNKLGEIDLIMSNKEVLVFVEVKLKVGDKFGSPEEMISKYKLNRIRRIAESF